MLEKPSMKIASQAKTMKNGPQEKVYKLINKGTHLKHAKIQETIKITEKQMKFVKEEDTNLDKEI